MNKASADAGGATLAEPLSSRQAGAVYRRLGEAFPNPDYEHPPSNQYQTLVAVLLSAQSTAVGVEKATSPLFAKVKTPRDMLKLGASDLREHIKTLGLFRNKTRHVIAMSQQLIDNHAGRVPKDRDALLALPGVGPKTADVILNVLFGKPAIAVDTHVFRICNRTLLAPGKAADTVASALAKVTPPQYAGKAHSQLFTLGREVCKARRPECWHCPIRSLCRYEHKTPEPHTTRTHAHP
jgi:endonuclease III